MFDREKKICTCERCGYGWKTESTDAPKSCAKCKSKGWNMPRVYAGKYVPATMAHRFKPTGRAAAKKPEGNRFLICSKCKSKNYVSTSKRTKSKQLEKFCRQCRLKVIHLLGQDTSGLVLFCLLVYK